MLKWLPGDLDSKTPLHWVASRGNANFLKLLLEAGADPNAKGTWSGRTPLLECSDNIGLSQFDKIGFCFATDCVNSKPCRFRIADCIFV